MCVSLGLKKPRDFTVSEGQGYSLVKRRVFKFCLDTRNNKALLPWDPSCCLERLIKRLATSRSTLECENFASFLGALRSLLLSEVRQWNLPSSKRPIFVNCRSRVEASTKRRSTGFVRRKTRKKPK